MQPAYRLPDTGFIAISGPDRVDFLQRQSTNDVSLLADNHPVTTVLTNAAARILDVLQLLSWGEETIGAVPLPGRASGTAQFLQKRVFFMDKVTVRDASAEICILDLEGAGAEMLAAFTGIPHRLITQRGLSGTAHRLVAQAALRERLVAAAESAGAACLSPQEYEVRRVEAGLPGAAGELVEAYTPLEVGLDALISSTKGCYTGQEVIARQITYDKVTKQLAGIRLAGAAAPGAKVTAAGAAAGEVTSAVVSPRHGAIALAVLKRPHFEPGTPVEVDGAAGVVTALPF
jgi:folate-binding protein YgfZ